MVSGISPVEEPRHPVSGCGYRKHSGQEGDNSGPPHWWAGVELGALACVLHTNYLKMLAPLLSLKRFLQGLKGYHVLVRTHHSILRLISTGREGSRPPSYTETVQSKVHLK